MPQSFYGALDSPSQPCLQLGEGHFDQVEVKAVGRQEGELRPGGLDGGADHRWLVAAQIVHDYDIARAQLGHQDLGDIGFDAAAVDRTVQDHRGGYPRQPKAGDEG